MKFKNPQNNKMKTPINSQSYQQKIKEISKDKKINH